MFLTVLMITITEIILPSLKLTGEYSNMPELTREVSVGWTGEPFLQIEKLRFFNYYKKKRNDKFQYKDILHIINNESFYNNNIRNINCCFAYEYDSSSFNLLLGSTYFGFPKEGENGHMCTTDNSMIAQFLRVFKPYFTLDIFLKDKSLMFTIILQTK